MPFRPTGKLARIFSRDFREAREDDRQVPEFSDGGDHDYTPPGKAETTLDPSKLSYWFIQNERRRQKEEEVAQSHRRKSEQQHRQCIERAAIAGTSSLASSSANFVYTPLSDPSTQVRLLQVGIVHGEVVCTQARFSLHDAPPFVAVSYTWGGTEDMAAITIDRKMHAVRRNCWAALRELAIQGIIERVWIDAVCIDQDNNHERAQQVQMMTTIFGQALWVAAIPQYPSSLQIYATPYNVHTTPGLEIPTALLSQKPHELSLDPYFSRIWIVQELLVAKKVQFLGHGISVDWEDLQRLWATRALDENTDRIHRLKSDRAGPNYSSVMEGIIHFLTRYSDLCCTDPRDKIYALVPLALQHSGKSRFRPNYDHEPFRVLVDFVHYVCTIAQWKTVPLYELLLCLMKLVQSFNLHLDSTDVRNFLDLRSNAGFKSRSMDKSASEEVPSTVGHFTNAHFEGICLGDASDSTCRYHICMVADLPETAKAEILAMGLGHSNTSSMQFKAICVEQVPVLIATQNVLAGDIVLTPGPSPMSWTWNLVFRKSAMNSNEYDLIGQAVPLKGSGPLLRRQTCCDGCIARQASKRNVRLHPDDVLALALLARDPSARLFNAVTVPGHGSCAELTSS